MPTPTFRILYYSNMTVSPGSGGGNTVFSLLEPAPEGAEVFYATRRAYPPHWAPFEEISARICWLPSRDDGLFPTIPRGSRFGLVRRLNSAITRANARWATESVVREILAYTRQLGIGALLLCPQGEIDTTARLLQRCKLPAVTWFMDNYYTDAASQSKVSSVWERSQKRLAVSEAMRDFLCSRYGGSCEVFFNSVVFPTRCPEPTARDNRPLKMAYAGALHSYYVDSVTSVLTALEGFEERVALDIYSHEELPREFRSRDRCAWRRLPALPAAQLSARLGEYDILLLLSSFKPEHRRLAETSFASKTSEYLAAGRCILVYGPEYSENVRYARRYGFAEVVTSRAPDEFRRVLLALARDPDRRRELGERAYHFGRERHEKETNRARFWNALRDVMNSAGRPR